MVVFGRLLPSANVLRYDSSMRFSLLFGKTLRDDPAEAETAGHKLLLKAGLVQQLAAGIYSYLPMALRSIRKIEGIIREEMDAAGGQEVLLPALQPADLWEKSGRDAVLGSVLFHLQDRRDRELVLGPTHEEVITELVHRTVNSYRDLPVTLYQIQTKFRDEPRPRAGLIRVREFAMKDAYSFHADDASLDEGYDRVVEAYKRIFDRCGLDIALVEADSGAIGGKDSQEFMVLTETGEDELVFCDSCHYGANMEKASSVKPHVDMADEQPLSEVETPGVTTIPDLAKFLGVTESKTIKAVFYSADGDIIIVAIRGDLEVNEIKLKNFLGVSELDMATDDQVKAAGLVAGYASPLGLEGIRRIADDSVQLGNNFVVGANKPNAHLVNANYPRDFQVDDILDIASARAGHACIRCGSELRISRGIEAGHVFKVGRGYSEKFDSKFLDSDGQEKTTTMGCYGIGVGRILGSAIEQNHDDRGVIFPPAIAPYQIHLVALNVANDDVREAAEKLYGSLVAAGRDVLFDDREESAGVKFNDADLLGMPLRVTVSPRSLQQGGVELKERYQDRNEARTVPVDDALSAISETISAW